MDEQGIFFDKNENVFMYKMLDEKHFFTYNNCINKY